MISYVLSTRWLKFILIKGSSLLTVAIAMLLAEIIGCGDNDENVNNVPIIDKLVVPNQIRPGDSVDFQVEAHDADGDTLTYMWIVEEGQLSSSTTQVVTWTAPLDEGSVTVSIKVSDGINNSVVKSKTITVSSLSHLPEETIPPDGMVLIPAGEFQMGSNNGSPDEKPVHTVYLDAFYIDKYEVTNAQYATFLNEYGKNVDTKVHKLLRIGHFRCLIEEVRGVYQAKSGYENHPVILVSWFGAAEYATFYGKCLPTEAEWEKAARGGLVGKQYPNGDTITHDDANYGGTGGRDIWEKTSPVGSFPPNGYGLYDMAGNAWEWCSDWHHHKYYIKSPKNNPQGPIRGTRRVLRGGSWNFDFIILLRCALRNTGDPLAMDYIYGFRCCVSRR